MACLALLAALVAQTAFAQQRPRVVVSIHPLFDLVSQVAGDDADVERLLAPGVAVHDFDPAPSDMLRIVGADLIVMNGGADEWLKRMIDAGGQSASTLVVTELAVLRAGVAARYPDQVEFDGSGAVVAFNPHVWLEPLLMRAVLPEIAAALAEIDPGNAGDYRARQAALAADLVALDAELAATLAPVAGAPFVPFHDAWPYFAARYGLDLVVEIEPFPGREPSASYLVEVLAQVASSGARTIFTEPQLGRRPAQVVAQEAGVELAELDPLGGFPGRESYQDLLRFNAAAVAVGLKVP